MLIFLTVNEGYIGIELSNRYNLHYFGIELTDCIVQILSQGLLNCSGISEEIYELASKGEVEEVLLPVLGWVAVLGLVSLLAGGICLGCYIYSR